MATLLLDQKKVICVLVLLCLCGVSEPSTDESTHTNNWAVIVCASRYWFNYRHVANALSIYRSVKRLGIPDSNIILMLADDMACNPRNPRPATVFNNANQHINVYGDDVEVDYRGYEVTVENFLRVLTGRVNASVPRSKKLLSDDRSNILVYMTGHGGDGFLKFQDAEEISNYELGDTFEQMWQKQRYNELMFLIDTCQAASMFRTFYSPNIIACGSSAVNEDALSHHMDSAIGVHIIDRWTYYALEFLEKVTPGSKATVNDFFSSFNPELVQSTPQVRSDLFQRKMDKALLTDFFGSVRNIELLNISTAKTKTKTKKDQEQEEDMEEEETQEEEEMGYATVKDMVERSARPVLDVPTVVGDTSVVFPEAGVKPVVTDFSPFILTAVWIFMGGITMVTAVGMYGLVLRR